MNGKLKGHRCLGSIFIIYLFLVSVIYLYHPVAVKAAQDVLIPQGSVWKYLDDGSDQGTAWKDASFNDSAWSSGAAQLGYGDGDEATVVSFGSSSSNKYTTTYFRHSFQVTNANAYASLNLRVLRDDGAVVYLNGNEVFRTNMPGGTVFSTTFASSAIGGVDESTFFESSIDPALLVNGNNLLAVEIHQANLTSSDISFDLELVASDSSVLLIRGPYLQMGTPDSVTVRWRTDSPSTSQVNYGTSLGNLDSVQNDTNSVTEHELRLSGLSPDTKYYYSVGTTEVALAGGDSEHFFVTSPPTGSSKPTRIWVIGDSGTANSNAQAVRNAYEAFSLGQDTDLWLMLGDNAYPDGTDSQYQAAVFNMYPDFLRNTVLWPTLGNHDGHSADSQTESGPYYDMFTLPRQGESGGVPSGTEAYYSFDYGDIHFVCLDSYDSDRSPGGAMMTWLQDDLSLTNANWIIAYWHHPPYSKGSHNSDTESQLIDMRQNALPILEAFGVDLVLSGHSHTYERSYLIDGHYGTSNTLEAFMILDSGDGNVNGDGAYVKPTVGPSSHEGSVYVVAGSSGQTSSLQPDAPHPVMFATLPELGSLVVDINGTSLEARFLDSNGNFLDDFTIVKGSTGPTCGNGIRESGEECDGLDFGGVTCSDFGCDGGSLSCTPSCTVDSITCQSCPICDSDGVCEAGEDCNSCPNDCIAGTGASCGNGVCEAEDGEDCLSCPQDCRGKQNGKPSGRYCCGDGDGQNPLSCADSICTSGGFACTDMSAVASCCGDFQCEGVEDAFSCEVDCGPPPICGDGACDQGETSCSCPADCGTPPLNEVDCTDGFSNDCDAFVDCDDSDCFGDPSCSAPCLPKGDSCTSDLDCCSSKCRGGKCR